MNTHKVTNGIFKGHEFPGQEIVISGQKRVWDLGTIGRSYEWKNVHRFRSTQHLLKFKHDTSV
jgi:hypothetical protein